MSYLDHHPLVTQQQYNNSSTRANGYTILAWFPAVQKGLLTHFFSFCQKRSHCFSFAVAFFPLVFPSFVLHLAASFSYLFGLLFPYAATSSLEVWVLTSCCFLLFSSFFSLALLLFLFLRLGFSSVLCRSWLLLLSFPDPHTLLLLGGPCAASATFSPRGRSSTKSTCPGSTSIETICSRAGKSRKGSCLHAEPGTRLGHHLQVQPKILPAGPSERLPCRLRHPVLSPAVAAIVSLSFLRSSIIAIMLSSLSIPFPALCSWLLLLLPPKLRSLLLLLPLLPSSSFPLLLLPSSSFPMMPMIPSSSPSLLLSCCSLLLPFSASLLQASSAFPLLPASSFPALFFASSPLRLCSFALSTDGPARLWTRILASFSVPASLSLACPFPLSFFPYWSFPFHLSRARRCSGSM